MDLDSGRVTHRVRELGTKSHALVTWRKWLLMLDSDNGGLIRVNPATGSYETLYTVRTHTIFPTAPWFH